MMDFIERVKMNLGLSWAIIKGAFTHPTKESIITWTDQGWKEETFEKGKLVKCPTCDGAGVVRKNANL